jgi:hypothetical protein
MKNLLHFALIVLMVMLGGCFTEQVYNGTYTGNSLITQPDYSVNVRLARIVHYNDVVALPEDSIWAEVFVLYFKGTTNSVTLDAISGNYQFKSRSVKPLTVKYQTASNAAFAAQSDDMKDGHLKPGPYTLNFVYTLDGQSYSINFHIKYDKTHKTKFWFFWDMRHVGDGIE